MTTQYKFGPPGFFEGNVPGTTTLPAGISPEVTSPVSLLNIFVLDPIKQPIETTLPFLTMTPSTISERAPMKHESSIIVGLEPTGSKIPFILVEVGYTEKNINEIPHKTLIKDFSNFEKIVEKYL